MARIPVVRRMRPPWAEMNQWARQMDNIFNAALTPSPDLWAPAVDVEETPDHLLFRAELPGVKRDDIDIELEDGVLTLQGEKKEEEREENAQMLLYERRWGTFSRRFTLPRAVDPNGIKASFQDGVLMIEVPKAEEAKGRKIRISETGRSMS